ncbi:MAG: CdaR family protein [Melioribacter sp.]|nr:CdaR family protein [Melioribacter sp.]
MKRRIIPIIFVSVFSLILWGSVSLSEYYVETITIPVELVDLPRKYSPSYISSDVVMLKLKAKGWDLAKIFLTGEHTFKVSAHHKIGKFKAELRNEIENNTWITSAFTVLEISPTYIEYEIDKTVSKTVLIKPVVKINLEKEYDLVSKISVSPPEVEIRGPASILQYIDSVETDSVVFNNVNERKKVEINLRKINGISYSFEKCFIEFDVQKIVEREFHDLDVEIRNVPPSKELILFPSKVSVVIKGGINKLGKLTKDSIKVYVDYWAALKSEEDKIEPIVELPNFTTLLDIKPNKLEFVIKQY